MPKDISAYCIYQDVNDLDGYIGAPTKIRENNETDLMCRDLPEMKLLTTFYAINPTFRPIPPGASLICATNKGGKTIDVFVQYDPFHLQSNCTTFIAWVEPVPYTTQIHLYKNEDSIFPSFTDNPPIGYRELPFSPIYVLIDPAVSVTRVPGITDRPGDFPSIKNEPMFLFKGYQGRCLPDPSGDTLGQCMILYVDDILKPHEKNSNKEQTLLTYLQQQLTTKRRRNPFGHVNIIFVGVVLFLFIVSVITVIWLVK